MWVQAVVLGPSEVLRVLWCLGLGPGQQKNIDVWWFTLLQQALEVRGRFFSLPC
jgi:hypothetical protein